MAEVENKWINGKVVQKHIRYIGKEVDGKTVLSSSMSNIEIDTVKLHGPLLVLNHLAGEIHLNQHLGEYADEILSLVYGVPPVSVRRGFFRARAPVWTWLVDGQAVYSLARSSSCSW